jgi:ribosomal protein S18 acetylase RimI-like enzyme
MATDSPIEVRPAVESDVPEIVRINVEAFVQATQGAVRDRTWLTMRSGGLWASRTHLKFAGLADVAVRGGTVLGASAYHRADEGLWFCASLYVDTTTQREGAGTALVETMLERVAARGGGTVELDAIERWQPAMDFYANTGFTRTGESHDEDIDGTLVKYVRLRYEKR